MSTYSKIIEFINSIERTICYLYYSLLFISYGKLVTNDYLNGRSILNTYEQKKTEIYHTNTFYSICLCTKHISRRHRHACGGIAMIISTFSVSSIVPNVIMIFVQAIDVCARVYTRQTLA